METIVRVARGEGLGSVAVRAGDRVSEAWQRRMRIVRGAWASMPRPRLLNVLTLPPSPRLGGVAVQLNARLDEERQLREVALFDQQLLQVGSRAWRAESLDAIGARTLIVEGAFGDLPRIQDSAEIILAIHDFSLISAHPHDLEVEETRRAIAHGLLERARVAIFPSTFLRDSYRAIMPRFEARVIEPGIADVSVRAMPLRNRIAFVGSVKPHKGGALIPEIMRAAGDAEWHVFGGGDVDLLRPLRGLGAIHGYYRAGSLSRLLARHRIGLAVLPSIVPESFSLTLSECWNAGVPVVAFDHGAIAERVRAHGGGFLVPREAGAEGIAARVRDWLRGATMPVPSRVPTARDAATAHVALYGELGVL